MDSNKIINILNKYILLVDFNTITAQEERKYYVTVAELFWDVMNTKIINDENDIDFAHKINNIISKYE